MKIINKTEGMINKFPGATWKVMRKKNSVPFDGVQKYMIAGEYNAGALEGTPHDEEYKLIVYKDTDNVLRQALCSANASDLIPACIGRFNERLNRCAVFANKRSVSIGVIIDVHYKDANGIDFYGHDGLRHIKEFNYLGDRNILDLKAHLDDWMDGFDPGLVNEAELISLSRTFRSRRTNFVVIKGSHDENDKSDRRHDLGASFPEDGFEDTMWPSMYAQNGIHYITHKRGIIHFDKDDIRIIIVNTSDLPYELDEQRKKEYDTKLSLAIREDQMQEVTEIPENSSGKTIIFTSHADPITCKGTNALKFNGRSLHESMVASNQREKGYFDSRDVPLEFTLTNNFNFTEIKNVKIVAYFCGHRHTGDQYRINGIQYISFNCSTLMGPNHTLTTQCNKR